MASPNLVYNSNTVPFGGFSINVFRPQSPLTPGTNALALGAYILESGTITYEGIMGERPAVDGGDNGWFMVNGKITGNATIQIATGVTPTLQTGDFFSVSTDANGENIESDSSGAVVTRRFVIQSPATAIGTTEYRKQSCSLVVDKFDS